MEKTFQPFHREFEPIAHGSATRGRAQNAWFNVGRSTNQPNADSRPLRSKTILVPVDLPESSPSSLGIARNLALKTGAVLVLVHAVWLNIAGEEHGIHRFRLGLELCRDAKLQLNQWAAELGENVRTQVLVCEGYPADVILEAALQLEADAIIMETHGRRGWHRWFHRNTASKVVKESSCPVWLVASGDIASTIDLMVMGRMASVKVSPRFAVNETPGAFRSLLRILSS